MTSRPPRKIYTRKGDDGTTGLLFGGRVAKDAPVIQAAGDIDEAQAVLGLVRAEVAKGSELDSMLVALERDLYVLMAEVATAAEHRDRLTAGTTMVTQSMVARLEALMDALSERFPPVVEFVLPGQDRISALLDLARTTVRRAERSLVVLGSPGLAGAYLNRLSDLLWTMARWQEDGRSLISRKVPS
jgi:cob(I)alamin adenosyltransferase